MRNPFRYAALFTSACILSGCAGYSANREIAGDEGIRYYELAPYLLVYSDGKGSLTSELRWLPNLDAVRVIEPYAYLAKNNSVLTFNKGVLTQSKFTLDSTTIPSALLDTIKTLGTAAVKSSLNSTVGIERELPAPYLFKIVIAADGTYLRGGQGTGPDRKPIVIKVSVTKEAVEASADAKEDNGDAQ